MLAALLLTVSLAAPTTLTDHGAHARRPAVTVPKHETRVAAAERAIDDPNAPDRDIGFVDHYMPFQLSPAALPAVKDGLILSHVFGYLLPFGGLWGPVVAIDGAKFTGDLFASYCLSSIIWFLAAAVVLTVTIGVGAITFFAVPYLTTTAALNAVDRQLKAEGKQPPKPNTPPNTTTTPPPPTDTPPPSYAY